MTKPTPSTRARVPTWAIVASAMISVAAALAALLVAEYGLGSPLGLLPPAEDSAMLLRYADNLAAGHGITYNAGEPPRMSDGATDLGMVFALAPLIVIGFSPVAAALLVNSAAAVLLAGTLAWAGRRFGVPDSITWLCVGTVVVFGPVVQFLASGFSPTVLGVILAWVALAALRGSEGNRLALVVSGALAGLAGLWRPEGFALGALVVAAVAARSWALDRTGLLRWTAAAAAWATVVAAWVAFRLAYVGQLVPTAGVNKVGGLHPHNAVGSLQVLILVLLPLLAYALPVAGPHRALGAWLVVLAAVVSLSWWVGSIPSAVDNTVFLAWWPALAPLSGWTTKAGLVILGALVSAAAVGAWRGDRGLLGVLFLFLAGSLVWAGVFSTVNWWHRMEWPLAAASAVLILASWPPHAAPRSILLPVSAALVLIAVTFHGAAVVRAVGPAPSPRNFSIELSSALARVPTADVRVATSEAGLIPLNTAGPAIDILGLNDRTIAEEDAVGVTKRFDAIRPNVVALHSPTPDALNPGPSCLTQPMGPWTRREVAAFTWAESNGLSLLYGTQTAPCDAWLLYVGDDLPAATRDALASVRFDGTPLVRS